MDFSSPLSSLFPPGRTSSEPSALPTSLLFNLSRLERDMIFKKPILRSFGYGRVVRQTAKTLVKTQQDIVPTLLLLMCVGLSKGEGDML